MKCRNLTVLIGVFIFFIAMACEETTIEIEAFDSDQVSLLLVSSDSFKIWQREAILIDGQNQPLSGCDKHQQLKFQISEEGDSILTNSVLPINGCPAETLISGEWKVSAGTVDTLIINSADTSIFRMINNITSRSLEYYYFQDNTRVTERFNSL